MEDDGRRAGRDRDAGGVVEHADRHVQLLPALGVAHEAGDRRVHGEHDLAVAAEVAEALCERVVHPELALEVDLAGRHAALQQQLERLFRRGLRRHRADRNDFVAIVTSLACVVRSASYPICMDRSPTRIDLLGHDLHLRRAELGRQAAGITEWSLDVVAAFMRAAYGKGYCDALTEDSPGSLCAEHGYRVPARKQQHASADA